MSRANARPATPPLRDHTPTEAEQLARRFVAADLRIAALTILDATRDALTRAPADPYLIARAKTLRAEIQRLENLA